MGRGGGGSQRVSVSFQQGQVSSSEYLDRSELSGAGPCALLRTHPLRSAQRKETHGDRHRIGKGLRRGAVQLQAPLISGHSCLFH